MYEILGFPVIFYSCSDVIECLASLTPETRHLFECSWIAYNGHPLFMILVEPDGKSFGLKLIPFH